MFISHNILHNWEIISQLDGPWVFEDSTYIIFIFNKNVVFLLFVMNINSIYFIVINEISFYHMPRSPFQSIFFIFRRYYIIAQLNFNLYKKILYVEVKYFLITSYFKRLKSKIALNLSLYYKSYCVFWSQACQRLSNPKP